MLYACGRVAKEMSVQPESNLTSEALPSSTWARREGQLCQKAQDSMCWSALHWI
jgi:hypothetical protein